MLSIIVDNLTTFKTHIKRKMAKNRHNTENLPTPMPRSLQNVLLIKGFVTAYYFPNDFVFIYLHLISWL